MTRRSSRLSGATGSLANLRQRLPLATVIASALCGAAASSHAQALTLIAPTEAATIVTSTAFTVPAPGSALPTLGVTVPAPLAGSSSSVSDPSDELPDAPSSLLPQTPISQSVAIGTTPVRATTFGGPVNLPSMPMERRYTKYVRPGYRGQPLNLREKVILGIRDSYSLGDLGATFVSAGYSHVANSQPNYGTDKGAFGARLGAAALREITEGLFTDSVFSVVLKEDPRYYAMGPQYSYVRRTLYSITRPLLTRTDSGHSTPNGALLAGYAASAAVALSYYPSGNRNFHDAASNFGGSIGGAALGYFVAEFQDDFLIALHLKKKP